MVHAQIFRGKPIAAVHAPEVVTLEDPVTLQWTTPLDGRFLTLRASSSRSRHRERE
jgi:hypothetical protein